MPKATQSWQFQKMKCRDEIGPLVYSSEKQLVLTKIPISQYILERLSQVLLCVVYEQWHCIKANCLQGPLITNEVNSETQVWVYGCACPEISCSSKKRKLILSLGITCFSLTSVYNLGSSCSAKCLLEGSWYLESSVASSFLNPGFSTV